MDRDKYVKFNDIIEELKKKKDVTGLPRYMAEFFYLVLIKKTDQTADRIV